MVVLFTKQLYYEDKKRRLIGHEMILYLLYIVLHMELYFCFYYVNAEDNFTLTEISRYQQFNYSKKWIWSCIKLYQILKILLSISVFFLL